MRQYFVYVMASVSRTLYVGMTNNLERRVDEHKRKETPGFTRHYNATRLVHVETYGDPRSAIAREKRIKGWRRSQKIELIEGENPGWADLSEGWDDGSRCGGRPQSPPVPIRQPRLAVIPTKEGPLPSGVGSGEIPRSSG